MDDERSPKSHPYFVPDYFLRFACKIGTCRTACCVGWPVSISQENYFRLLGVDCSTDLRRRLDCAMRMADYPTPECYAHFEHRYDGECALHLPDGRCALHAELGEDMLADVCRLYPRGIRRSESGDECSAANSCEATLEQLWALDAPITFVEAELQLEPPTLPPCSADLPTREERLALISLLQKGEPPAVAIEEIGGALDCDVAQDTKDLAGAFAEADALLTHLGERSDAIGELADRAKIYLRSGDYTVLKQAFLDRFPGWESFVCRALVNHLFFLQFPVSCKTAQQQAEFRALCAVYGLMCIVAVGCTGETGGEVELIDACAALFRLVEHSNFTATVNRFFRERESACVSMLSL